MDAGGEILLKNYYCKIRIRTSPGLSMTGIGAYSMLLGIESPGYWTQQYIVRITATFTPWLVGHPRMALIKRWATGILDGLQQTFDEQIIWQKTVENYTLRQHLPPSMKDRTRPFGPVRCGPSKEPANKHQ